MQRQPAVPLDLVTATAGFCLAAACPLLGLARVIPGAIGLWLLVGGSGAAVLAPFLAGGWLTGLTIQRSSEAAEPQRTGSPAEPAATRSLLQLQGRVVTASTTRGEDQRCLVQLDSPAPAAEVWLHEPTPAVVRFAGDRLRFEGRYHPPGTGRNPGESGSRRGSLWVHPARPAELIRQGPPGVCRLRDRLAQHLAQLLQRRLEPPAAGLCAALLLGRPQELAPATQQLLRDTGAYHFVAVSGFHVALVGAGSLRLLRWLRVPVGRARLLALAAVGGYALLSGARPPVVRATLVFAAWLWTRHRRRPSSLAAPLGAALLALALFDPLQLRAPGLQLSFVAVFGISAAARYRRIRSPRGSGHGIQLWEPVARVMAVAVAATLATAPLTALHFGTVCPWSPLSSLVAGPLILPLFLGGAAQLVCASLSTELAAGLAPPVNGLGRALVGFLKFIDVLPGTPVPLAAPPPLAVTVLLLALLALFRRRPAIATGLVAAAWLAAALAGPARPSGIGVLDVGHGQALLLRTGERCDLFDAGGFANQQQGGERLVQALRALHVSRLDGLFLSHLDADHAGHAATILRQFPCRELLVAYVHRDQASTWAQLAALRAAAKAHGTRLRLLQRGDRIGPHEVLWPPANRRFLSSNEGSLVLRVATPRAGTVLLPGDLSGPLLVELARLAGCSSDILVLPHHGNADPNLPAFLQAADPLLAIASRGDPLPDLTRAQLASLGIPFRSTHLRGALLAQP